MSLAVPLKDVKNQQPGTSLIVSSKGGVSLDTKPINEDGDTSSSDSELEGLKSEESPSPRTAKKQKPAPAIQQSQMARSIFSSLMGGPPPAADV